MNVTGTLFTTPDGWTIDATETVARYSWLWLRRFCGGNKGDMARLDHITVDEVRRRLQDHTRPPAPIITPEAEAILAKPLPEITPPENGSATEAHIIRLSALMDQVDADCSILGGIVDDTLYKPPSNFEARFSALNDIWVAIQKNIAATHSLTDAALEAIDASESMYLLHELPIVDARLASMVQGWGTNYDNA